MMSSTVSVDFQREGNHGEMRTAEKWARDGIWYVEGIQGRRFLLNITNRSNARIEVVVSVDGLDIGDGEEGSTTKRGLVINPWSTFAFEGFRTSQSNVATFRFIEPGGSYAGLTGKPKNVGIIGIAVFKEKVVTPLPWTLPSSPIKAPWEKPTPWTWEYSTRGNTADASRDAGHAGVTCSSNSMPMASPGGQSLGTEFGESRLSEVGSTTFTRASRVPETTFTLRYENRETLMAMGFSMQGPVIPGTPEAFPADNKGYCKPPPTKACM